jgi:threonine dehydratase
VSRTTLGLQSILHAHQRIARFIGRTPLVRSGHLSARTGAFKVRGALNKVGLLTPAEKRRGIVTGSAGNHGLGVAYAAQSWGDVSADIFVQANAPRAKVDKLRQFDVTVHLQGDTYEDAHQAAETFARENGATYIPAYDDVDIIAGQGTMGLEILTELPGTDLILVPIGGGGMIAGVATAAKAMNPGCRVIGVQPEASPAALLSLRDGVPYDPYDHEPTIADGLAGGFGALPFYIAGTLIEQVLLASEADLRQAIFTLLDREQLVVEASGAITIAPLLNGALDVAGQKVVCILSGGNIESTLLRDILIEFTS